MNDQKIINQIRFRMLIITIMFLSFFAYMVYLYGNYYITFSITILSAWITGRGIRYSWQYVGVRLPLKQFKMTCNSHDLFVAIQYFYSLKVNYRVLKKQSNTLLYALQIDLREEKLAIFLSENKELLLKKRPIQYLFILLNKAAEEQDQKSYQEILEEIDTRFLQNKKYQTIKRDVQCNNYIFQKEYLKALKFMETWEIKYPLDKLYQEGRKLTCYFALQEMEKMQEALRYCEKHGMQCATIRKKVIEIKKNINQKDAS